ncbi:uncharacterized protein TRUGW13939_10992 [Talaromyces rugulosus]|uniref:N-acetylgalactosaminide beta-1,3-galactosyltransferase n=1 Tax=Talaromyces rugulosus TaxID=121627 RepID=A0A7H8RDM2_TALRU|nr:uncharacterized protein TRUGW13939_10992 [Talaromyces rugulosus]QKX63821.1 hypothetical protein TRUGW13939_10992 [Talaromyces rugulosus]
MLPLRRKSRRWIPFAATLLGLLVVLQLLRGPQWSMLAGAATRSSGSDTSRSTNSAVSTETPANSHQFLCPSMPGIEDVLVVLKTGVTEALDKVPVHARTTFRCVPNYLVVSDYEETIEGVQLHDVLTHVQDGVKANIEDFNLYNRLKIYGRQGLVDEDATEEENGVFGMPNNPGWKLDKWKFLPMIDEALKMKPTAKWFVFMEADTHIVWPNLVHWVTQLNHQEPHYLGTETQIGEVLFAHGGSGFILSQTAMRLASMQRKTFVDEYDEYTDLEWAGDMVLGKVLKDAGVDLTFTWPLLQNARLGEIEPLTNNFYRQPWCWPVVGFHHLSPEDVEQMWKFDQDWFIKRHHKYLLHSDVFRERLLPQMTAGIHQDWDNLAGDLVEDPSVDTVVACRKFCEKDGLCRQFSFRWDEDPDNGGVRRPECRTFESPRLGVAREGTQSGWMMTRIELTSRARGYCQWPEWQ